MIKILLELFQAKINFTQEVTTLWILSYVVKSKPCYVFFILYTVFYNQFSIFRQKLTKIVIVTSLQQQKQQQKMFETRHLHIYVCETQLC